MSHLMQWLTPQLVSAIGWTLIHFLWQGFALAGLLYLALPLCRSATARHDLALAVLMMMGAAPVLTFLFLHTEARSGATLIAAPGLLSSGALVGGAGAVPSLHPDLLLWLVAVWLTGVAALSLRAVGGWCLAETWRRVDTLALPAEVQRRCSELQRRLACSPAVRFLQSRRIRTPMVVGWFKPVVLLPVSAVSGLPVQQLDALIVHELAHIMRLDAFANVVQVAVETALFYHPAVWWVSRQVRAEREHCCDDIAVTACGDVGAYVEALISLEAGRGAPKLSLAASGGDLKERVMRLLNISSTSRRRSSSALVGLALLGFVVGGVATAQSSALPAGHQDISIRVVDDTKDTKVVPAGDDRVLVSPQHPGIVEYLLLKRAEQISGDVLAEARVVKGPSGKPVIWFTLKPEAAEKFEALTQKYVGHRLAIVVNKRVLTAPMIREPIQSASGEIDANFATKAEADLVVAEMMGTSQ